MAPALLRVASLALRASSAICPATPTCPQDNQCSYISNGVSLQVSCATDFYGGDLQLAQTATLAGCMKACAATSNCAAVSYVGRNCYMKSTLNAAQANDNVIGAAVISRETASPGDPGSITTCPTSYTCPENDGCTYKGTDGRTFALKCNADYYGGDFTSMYAESLQSCNNACAGNAQCVAASFVGGKSAGYCYLKDKNNGAAANDNVDSFAIDTRVPASSTITPSSSSTASPSSSNVAFTESSSSLSSTSTPTPTPTSSTPTPTPTSSTPSVTPTPKPTGPQIIVNPSFENGNGNGASPWTPNASRNTASTAGRVNSDARSGSSSYQVTAASAGTFVHWVEQPITAVVGQSYDVSVWAKVTPELGSCYVITYVNSSRPATVPLYPSGAAYQQFTVTYPSRHFTQAANTFTVVLRCDGARIGGKGWIDDVTMTQVIS